MEKEIITEGLNVFQNFEKERCQSITMSQLEVTSKENDIYGRPLKGIYHFELFKMIMNSATKAGYEVELYDMFACQNKEKSAPGVVILPQVEEKFGMNAVEAHILRRVYANIRIKDFDTDELTTNLAVAFHQKGIQVGFGNNVRICHNQCMLGKGQYVATYGKDSVTIEQLLSIVNDWLATAKDKVYQEREKIERMKNTYLTSEQIYIMIGMLTEMRVRSDSKYEEIKIPQICPLNQAQISKFTESMLLKAKVNSNLSVWDAYNSATDIYKVDSLDMPMVLPMNLKMVEFLDANFL